MLSKLTMKLLAKEPERRYQSAVALRKDLEEVREREARGSIDSFELGRLDVPYGLFLRGRLYGREVDQQELARTVQRALGGQIELFLVTGPEGIGKSALIQEALEAASGKFRCLSGKGDLLRGNAPYAPMIGAFTPLLRELSLLSPDERAALGERLATAIAPNGRALTDVFPELETLVGTQPALPDAGLVETENRFQLAFAALVAALVELGPPIILFLDDLQWTDAATLKLVRTLATSPGMRSLLLLGAYRSTEVGPDHPVTNVVTSIRDAGTPVSKLELTPLDKDAVGALLCDGLELSVSQADPLAAVVYRKTAGNPFFIRRFLGFLHRSGVLRYQAWKGEWTWDLESADTADVTENVVELLAKVIRMQPWTAQEALSIGACIGNRFSLSLLARSCAEKTSVADLTRALWAPVHEGLLFATGEDPRFSWAEESPVELANAVSPAYRFCHDRIQQAAYQLLPVESRKEMHLRIGQLLLALCPAHALDDVICPIVDQLDRAADLIHPRERIRVAELNAMAGRQARARAAYGSAVRYFRVGLELLPSGAWNSEHHNLWFGLQRDAAECGAHSGDYALCERLVEDGLDKTGEVLERAELLKVIVEANATRGRHVEAVRRGREAARELGVELPELISHASLQYEAERVEEGLADKTDEMLLEATLLLDPVERARLELLANLVAPGWFSDLDLLKLASFRAVEMTATKGFTPASSAAYTFYGIALALDGKYTEANRYGQLGVRLAERSGSAVQEARALAVLGGHLSPWRDHVRESIPLLRRAHLRGVESGELQFAGYALAHLVYVLLFAGSDLDEVIAEANATIDFYRRLGHRGGPAFAIPAAQAARCLKGLTRGRACLDDEQFDEIVFLEEAADNGVAQSVFHMVRLQTSYLLGATETARESAQKSAKWLGWMRTLFFQAEHFFYSSLACADAWRNAPDDGQRAALAAELRANLEKLDAWAKTSPTNYQHKRDLIAADLAAIDAGPADALVLYHRAIEEAGRNVFVQDEAIANERCARLLAAHGDHRVAATYLRAAMDGYKRWGASAKVEALEQEYPAIAAARRLPLAEQRLTPSVLDYVSLLEAAETLTSELVLEPLIEKLTRICSHVVSAERTMLVLDQGGLVIRATANARGDVTLENTPVAGGQALPENIVDHLLRSGQVVVLGDAQRDARFRRDPYLTAHGVKSLFAIPIGRSERRVGLLYFENNLVTDAFSNDRVEMMRLLAGEIAVALENSLYFEERGRALSLLEATIDATAEGILVVDQAGKVSAYNQRFLSLFGIPPEIAEQEDRQVWLAYVREQLADPEGFLNRVGAIYGQPECDSFDAIHFKDGRVFERYSRPQRINRRAVGRVWSFRDVTQRERLLQQAEFLAETTRLLATLDVEPALQAVAARSVPYLGDACAFDLFAKGDVRRLALALVSAAGVPTISTELHSATVAGQAVIYVRESRDHLAVPLLVKGAVIGGLTLRATPSRRYNPLDLELAEELAQRASLAIENARLYREAHEALQARDEFLAISAHEIRGPLTSIHLAAQALGSGTVPTHAVPDTLALIAREDQRLARFVSDLLDFGRMRAGRIEFKLQEVDLGQIVRNVKRRLGPQLDAAGSTLSISMRQSPVGHWDKARLDQVVTNLLSNAIKFGMGKPIEVVVDGTEEKATLVVTDQGMGIPTELGERVFHPFERGVSVRHYGGLGLGLYIVRTLVEQMGGSVSVQSKPTGGSAFKVELPRFRR
jgi:predicted ATPase/signal transduction histidine kinase